MGTDEDRMSQRLAFELSFESLAGLISPARRFVEETMERIVHDPEDVFRAVMATRNKIGRASCRERV